MAAGNEYHPERAMKVELNADVNAAINIREAGHALLAGGAVLLGAAVKQEPLAA
jgi:transposase